MTPNARAFLLGLGASGIFGGLLMMALTRGFGGLPMLGFGALVVASVVFEHRYGRPGARASRKIAWEPTGERFVDDETGTKLEVWMDPLTGERRYEPIGSDPRLPPRKP